MSNQIFHSRILELLAATQKLSSGLNKRFSLDHQSEKLVGTFYVKEESHRLELEAMLAEYDDILRASKVYLRPPHDALEDFVSRCKFKDIEEIAVAEIDGFLPQAREIQAEDPAYAFTIWTDVYQGRWDYQICLNNGLQSALSKKRLSTSVYDSPRGTEGYKYYEYSSFGFYPGKELKEHLDRVERLVSEFSSEYGDKFDLRHCFELMLDTVSRVLNSSYENIQAHMLTTDNFIVFPRLYDQDLVTTFRAACKTLSDDQLQEVMGHTFAKVLI